jgi:hypothetical protein
MSRASARLPAQEAIKTDACEMDSDKEDEVEKEVKEVKEVEEVEEVEEVVEEEEEEEFEEILVYLEFPDFDDNSLLHDTARVELYDITGANPTCKVGNLTFTGSSEVNLGTQLFMDTGANGEEGRCIGRCMESINVVQFKLSKVEG